LVGLGVLVLLLGWVTAGPAFAEIPAGADEQEEAEASEEEPDSEEDADGQQQRRPGFGGPNQVENQIMLEEIEKPLLQRWADWKSGLVENKGLSFGIDYSAVYLGASDSPGEDSASSGMVRFFGSWDLNPATPAPLSGRSSTGTRIPTCHRAALASRSATSASLSRRSATRVCG
jgi:hypothetical protein